MTALSNTVTKVFGAGNVYALVNGLTPVRVGVLQDVEVNISSDVAELFGQLQYPVAIGRGKSKITGKAKTGEFNLTLFNELYVGGTVETTYKKVIENEALTAGASLPTATVSKSSAGIVDLGLYYQSNGVQLSYSTAAAPTIGNYNVSTATGVYTVSTAETSSTPFYSNYQYADSSGNYLAVANSLMGTQPVFQLVLWEGYTDFSGRTNFDLQLNRCVATKFSFPFKNTDFMVSDFEFEAFADSAGNVFTVGVGAN